MPLVGNLVSGKGETRATVDPQPRNIMADVIILRLDKPHDRVENLGRRRLKPLSDPCNVVELWRVRLDRDFEQLDRVLAEDYRRAGD
jgi:hypothetical protein